MEHVAQLQDGEFVHVKGKIQPDVENVTHSCSALTSHPSSPQEVNNTKNARKNSSSLRSKKLSSDLSQKTKEGALPCADTPSMETLPAKEDECALKLLSGDFEFSRRLVELSRKRRIERKRKMRRQSYRKSKTRKTDCYQSPITRRRKHSSQPHLCSEDLIDSSDSWSKDQEDMYEYSKRLIALSTKKKRFQPHEHAHCCRCVQSFECFWPRSNLQTIRMHSM